MVERLPYGTHSKHYTSDIVSGAIVSTSKVKGRVSGYPVDWEKYWGGVYVLVCTGWVERVTVSTYTGTLDYLMERSKIPVVLVR